MVMGPVEVVIVSFPSAGLTASIGHQLKELTESGLFRVVDAIMVQGRGADMVVTDLDDSVIPGWSSISPQPRPLLSADDGSWATEGRGADEASVVMVLEHVWPDRLANATSEFGGELAMVARINATTVEAALRFGA
jgi:hypothetical protein